ncbi:hypothetical protein G7046_g1004 [Stylonectria norvegica]|nr:hypothetical protein G7046_g1004 [Stylonectria norvegica]
MPATPDSQDIAADSQGVVDADISKTPNEVSEKAQRIAILKGRWGVPSSRADSLDDELSRVVEIVADVSKKRTLRFKRHAFKDVHPAVPQPVFDEHWTEADEDQLSEEWKIKKESWAITGDRVDVYETLWKVCLEYAQCTPWDIIGEKTRLKFQLAGTGSVEAEKPTKLMSQSFITALTPLILHRTFESDFPKGRATNIAMALQYLVILQTNDQRRWDLDVFAPLGLFLLEFQKIIDEQGPRPMQDLHKLTRQRCISERIDRPVVSYAFEAIETYLEENEVRTTKAVQGDPAYYEITTKDLTTLKNALDGMVEDDTYERGNTVQGVYDTYYLARTQGCHVPPGPPSRDQLHEWHDLAIRDQIRHIKRQERRLAHERGLEPERIRPAAATGNLVTQSPAAEGILTGSSSAPRPSTSRFALGEELARDFPSAMGSTGAGSQNFQAQLVTFGLTPSSLDPSTTQRIEATSPPNGGDASTHQLSHTPAGDVFEFDSASGFEEIAGDDEMDITGGVSE